MTPSDSQMLWWMQELTNTYGPTMDMSDLSHVFKRSRNGIKQSVYAGTFPIPMIRSGRQRLARTRDVALYLAQARNE